MYTEGLVDMSGIRRDRVFVLGGGPSLSTFNFSKLKNEDTICSNQAVFDVPSPDYFITCDYMFVKRTKAVKLDQLNCTMVFVANFIDGVIQDVKGKIVDIEKNYSYDLCQFDMIIKCRKRSGMGLTFKDFRSGRNSGYCGLQLAVLLGYRKIYLLGMDFVVVRKRTHYHNKYMVDPEKFSKKLHAYYNEFVSGLEQLKRMRPEVDIISMSEISKLNGIIPVEKACNI